VNEAAADAAISDAAISDEEVEALLEKEPQDGVRPFDFNAHRISRTQLPMLELACKTFAERAGSSLTALLGRDTEMQFDTLQTTKAGELQAGLPLPATLAVVRLKPLPGHAFINVEPALLLTLLDGFFGGSGRASGDSQAAIAPAAQRFLALMIRSLAADVSAAFAQVTPLEVELVKQESNPQFVQLGEPLDTVIVAKFKVNFGAAVGGIDWLMPESVLAPIREKLASDGSPRTVRPKEDWSPSLRAGLQSAEIEVRAILAEAEISLRDLVSLSPGDVIPIDAPQSASLLAESVPLYRGRFGISQGHNALKIISGGIE
jgi:flagellar motor switch protein FliM